MFLILLLLLILIPSGTERLPVRLRVRVGKGRLDLYSTAVQPGPLPQEEGKGKGNGVRHYQDGRVGNSSERGCVRSMCLAHQDSGASVSLAKVPTSVSLAEKRRLPRHRDGGGTLASADACATCAKHTLCEAPAAARASLSATIQKETADAHRCTQICRTRASVPPPAKSPPLGDSYPGLFLTSIPSPICVYLRSSAVLLPGYGL